MGLSKKHFKAVAEIINKALLQNQEKEELIQTFVDYFATENAQFMPDKFRCACHGVKWTAKEK